MSREEKEQCIQIPLEEGFSEMESIQILLKKCIDLGFSLTSISRAVKLSEEELQKYMNGFIPSDISRMEYLQIFLILLLKEKPVSDFYYRELMEELHRVFEISEETIARYAGVNVTELQKFENSDKREQIERCIAHLFVTFIRDSRFTCENGPWVTIGSGK